MDGVTVLCVGLAALCCDSSRQKQKTERVSSSSCSQRVSVCSDRKDGMTELYPPPARLPPHGSTASQQWSHQVKSKR